MKASLSSFSCIPCIHSCVTLYCAKYGSLSYARLQACTTTALRRHGSLLIVGGQDSLARKEVRSAL